MGTALQEPDVQVRMPGRHDKKDARTPWLYRKDYMTGPWYSKIKGSRTGRHWIQSFSAFTNHR